MTLIGFALYDDHAEAVADTVAYTSNLEQMSTATKVLALPHLDTLVVTQGDGGFSALAKYGALMEHQPTFDALAAEGAELFSEAWMHATNDLPSGAHVYDSTAFLIGWSDRLGRFAAYMYATEQDCKQIEIKKPFIMPSTTDYRPSGLEARRIRKSYADDPETSDLVDAWMTRPQMTAPASPDEWVALAAKARRQRAYADWAPIVISGDLLHATVSRGDLQFKKVHTFDETGDEFLQLVAWTDHPLALAQPCWCDSGTPFGKCRDTTEHDQRVAEMPE